MLIDDKFTWSSHINDVATKISKSNAILFRLRYILPRQALISLYYALIYPHLIYCNILWGGASQNLISKLLKLQKRAIRTITHSKFCAASSPLFRELNLLKIDDIYNLQVAVFAFKYKNNLLPMSCYKLLQVVSSAHYTMRRVMFFNVPNYRTRIRERSISVVGPRVWEDLPLHLQNTCNGIKCFKKMCKEWFILNY